MVALLCLGSFNNKPFIGSIFLLLCFPFFIVRWMAYWNIAIVICHIICASLCFLLLCVAIFIIWIVRNNKNNTFVFLLGKWTMKTRWNVVEVIVNRIILRICKLSPNVRKVWLNSLDCMAWCGTFGINSYGLKIQGLTHKSLFSTKFVCLSV